MAIPELGPFLRGASITILCFSIFGILMYILVGWTLGWMCDYLRRLSKRRLSQKLWWSGGHGTLWDDIPMRDKRYW